MSDTLMKQIIKHIQLNKTTLCTNNVDHILHNIIDFKELKDIINMCEKHVRDVRGMSFNDLFSIYNTIDNNKDRDSDGELSIVGSFVLLYFLSGPAFKSDDTNPKDMNRNKRDIISRDTTLLSEYISIMTRLENHKPENMIDTDSNSMSITDIRKSINSITDSNINRNSTEINDLITNNSLDFETSSRLLKSGRDRDQIISNYKFKTEFISIESDRVRSFLKYLKILAGEEIAQQITLSDLSDLSNRNRNTHTYINNKEKHFKSAVNPIYTTEQYYEYFHLFNQQKEEAGRNQNLKKEHRKSKLSSYINNNDINKHTECEGTINKVNGVTEFHLDDLQNNDINNLEEEESEEENRLLKERKEYYSSGNTHNRG